MRKAFLIISICILILLGCSSSKYPKHYPSLSIVYNGKEFEAKANEVTWGETNVKGQEIGSSLISVPELDIAKYMDNIHVQPNDVLDLKLEYDKDISEIYAIKVEGFGDERKTSSVDIVDNSVKVPAEKGEYVYSIKVTWDSTPESSHFVSYVVKLNVI